MAINGRLRPVSGNASDVGGSVGQADPHADPVTVSTDHPGGKTALLVVADGTLSPSDGSNTSSSAQGLWEIQQSTITVGADGVGVVPDVVPSLIGSGYESWSPAEGRLDGG